MLPNARQLISISIAGLALTLGACDGVQPGIKDESALVTNTPTYRANRYFYTVPIADNPRIHEMKRAWELPPTQHSSNIVRHGDPVTIVVNRAYVPETVGSGKLDKTRDILVLMDVGPANKEEFIAVYYQRDVPADETLTFNNIPIYSLDAWNDRSPPRFRMRLVDVSAERNTQIRALFDIVNELGGGLVSVVGTPAAGAAFSVASTVARLALGNEKNRNLVDFEFYLFSETQISQAGGVPLGTFRKGGLIVMGTPLSQAKSADLRNAFWSQSFQFDFNLERIQHVASDARVVASPYLFATVLTAETTISNLVKRRSQYITKILENPTTTVDPDFEFLVQEAQRLAISMEVLEKREDFKNFPTVGSFKTLLATIKNSSVPKAEMSFMLSTLRQVTGVTKSNAADYSSWLRDCGAHYKFDQKQRRFVELDANSTPGNCL